MEIGKTVEAVRRTAGRVMRQAARVEQIPYDSMDHKSVCRTIRDILKPSVAVVGSDETKLRLFSTIDVADKHGHHDISADPKLIEEFRRKRERLRLILDDLIKNDVLEETMLDEPDDYGETIYYGLKRDENGSIERAETKRKQIEEGVLILKAA